MGATTSTLTTKNTISSNNIIKSDVTLPVKELHVHTFSKGGKNYKLFYIKGKSYKHILKFNQIGSSVQPTFTLFAFMDYDNTPLPDGWYYGLIGNPPNLVGGWTQIR